MLNPHGDIPHDSEYPEINRHPGIWIKPNSADLEICTEFVKWENTSGRPLERCWSSHNVEFWKELKVACQKPELEQNLNRMRIARLLFLTDIFMYLIFSIFKNIQIKFGYAEKINEWYTINLSQFCWVDEDYYYDYGYDYYDYYDYRLE